MTNRGAMNDTAPPEIWGGVECTCNRVGNNYIDQLTLSGHHRRIDDLDLFAELGIKTLRYPVLWERTAPNGLASADWTWPDARLQRLRELQIQPIVGLVHHGSGPLSTSLVSDNFPDEFSSYAAAVAERYPWVDAYTPINEPLTTARFSALYGHWYPHAKSDHAFAQALINECKATVLAMRAIRRVNPAAKLVQTEDLGQTHCTPKLRYQAELENERRWASFHLLAGKLETDHLMWQFLLRAGATEAELNWFRDNPCPPDILGCNYYVTGERFLDERLDLYPAESHGGNGQHRYADVEAVRVHGLELAGWTGLLTAAWSRFGLPLAITEVHLGCHREEQLRWFLDAWKAAQHLRDCNVDVRAITAWSLLGSFNWNSLVTRNADHYESGVFDLSATTPRPTALATLICDLIDANKRLHKAVPNSGWWKRPSRVLYRQRKDRTSATCDNVRDASAAGTPSLLITGANGTLGIAFQRICHERELRFIAFSRKELDITDPVAVARALRYHQPWAVVNAAGYVRVDDAETDSKRCHRTNVTGAEVLAKACAAVEVQLLTFSSDLVFSGTQNSPYRESDDPCPLNVYGRSKLAAEEAVVRANAFALVVRTSAFFGPWDRYNFLAVTLRKLANGIPVEAADDWFVSPTYVPDLVHRCLDLLIDEEAGVWHLANNAVLSWAELARLGAAAAGLDPLAVQACRGRQLNLRAPRPKFSALGSERGRLLPPITDALQRFCKQSNFAELHHVRLRTNPPIEQRPHYAILSAAYGPASASPTGA